MIQNINLGNTPNDKTGDKARVAGGKINANFAYLDAKIDNINYLSTDAGYDLTGTNLTMNAGWVWTIEGVVYTNPVDVVIAVPLAASGYSRIDLIVCNASNTFTRVAGTPSLSTPVSPVIPDNTILAVFYVSDATTVGTPVIPNPRFSVSQLIRENMENTAPSEAAVFDALVALTAGSATTSTIGALINSADAATPNNADLVATAEVDGLLKKITWTNVKAFLKTYFDTLYAAALGSDENYVTDAEKTVLENTSGTNTGDQDLSTYSTLAVTATETGTSFALANTDNGKVIIITTSCTVTIPNGLMAGFNATFVTLTGVTLTVALGGAVVLHNNTGTTMAEKSSFTLQARTATNNYITAGAL